MAISQELASLPPFLQRFLIDRGAVVDPDAVVPVSSSVAPLLPALPPRRTPLDDGGSGEDYSSTFGNIASTSGSFSPSINSDAFTRGFARLGEVPGQIATGISDTFSSFASGVENIFNGYYQSFIEANRGMDAVTTRAGNVIGGGDLSPDRIVPDCIRALRTQTPIEVRNPVATRPWQHVLDPLMGYLILAKKQYKNEINNNGYSWNFGPSKDKFKKVIDVVKYIKKKEGLNYILKDSNLLKETNVLKLNSFKAKKKLKWFCKWSLIETLNKTIEWNIQVKKGNSAKIVCEKQFLMHIDNNR